ncbi:MAG: hypothetical protein M1835_000965 [Candelina submexicana]|nr:MAG: hypothetical protein M1835_000965 [Candelina submexicana]
MSFSYDRYERQRRQTYGNSSRRSAFGYWLPLALTVTVATVGAAAWIWSERRDHDEDDDDSDERDSSGRDESSRSYGAVNVKDGSTRREGEQRHVDDESIMSRMSGALRRTPSPQQLLDGASRKVAAGVAAAGAVVGGALSSIREEDKDDYVDHSRWSEEAQARVIDTEAQSVTGSRAVGSTLFGPGASSSQKAPPSTRQPNQRKKTAAIVVSALVGEDNQSDLDPIYPQEHASILSHLPEHVNLETTRIFVLIYAPDLKRHPLTAKHSGRSAESMGSSFSNIGYDDAQTPGTDTDKCLASVDPNPISDFSSPQQAIDGSPLFIAMYSQARGLVEKETMVIPFTTPTGHVHLLRHLAPEIVYVQASLSGINGDAVTHISGWVGQVVLVVGDDGGHGGLVDSEDESGHSVQKEEKWWEQGDRVGLGKGIEIVESLRVGEDWGRRVNGKD